MRNNRSPCPTCIAIVIPLVFLIAAGEGRADEAQVVKQTFTYKTVGDLDLKADVYRPDDKKLRPVVISIHGGALILGHRGSLAHKDLRDSGFVIVSIDYRLAPETKLPQIIEDVEDAYRWVYERGPELFQADTKKIAVVGGSAGGYLTLTAGFRAKPRPTVLVSFWGYGDLVGDWYSQPSSFYRKQPLVSQSDAMQGVSGPELADGRIHGNQRGAFYLYCRQQGLWPKLVTSFDPRTEADEIRPYMPVSNVTADYPPTLLVHGTIDTDVPYEQSVLMEREFKKHGVPHRFITVEGAGHGLRPGDPKLVKQAQSAVLPFLKKYLQE
jgi:acetyl esterase/lipase